MRNGFLKFFFFPQNTSCCVLCKAYFIVLHRKGVANSPISCPLAKYQSADTSHTLYILCVSYVTSGIDLLAASPTAKCTFFQVFIRVRLHGYYIFNAIYREWEEAKIGPLSLQRNCTARNCIIVQGQQQQQQQKGPSSFLDTNSPVARLGLVKVKEEWNICVAKIRVCEIGWCISCRRMLHLKGIAV